MSRRFDASALSEIASRPGIDPRVWLTEGVITELGHDPAHGQFADIQPMPTGSTFTAYLGQAYAGADFGAHFPAKVGDTVLVAIPHGDTGNAPWVIARRWDASDNPPVEVGEGDEPTANVVIKVEKGQKLQVIVDGAGEVQIESRGTGDVSITTARGDVIVKTGGKVYLGDKANAHELAQAHKVDFEIQKLWNAIGGVPTVADKNYPEGVPLGAPWVPVYEMALTVLGKAGAKTALTVGAKKVLGV
jgi:hypothetical protein